MDNRVKTALAVGGAIVGYYLIKKLFVEGALYAYEKVVYEGVGGDDPTNQKAGKNLESLSYKGHGIDVAYFDDWYNGKGWRFRYPQGFSGFCRGCTDWGGGFDTKEQAIASAKYTIDLGS